jgi:Tfp pilus assembly protein FimT
VAPDKHCSLSGAPLAAALTSARTVALQASVAVNCCADSRCSAWCTGQSGGTPDSPMNYSGVALEKPEGS